MPLATRKPAYKEPETVKLPSETHEHNADCWKENLACAEWHHRRLEIDIFHLRAKLHQAQLDLRSIKGMADKIDSIFERELSKEGIK